MLDTWVCRIDLAFTNSFQFVWCGGNTAQSATGFAWSRVNFQTNTANAIGDEGGSEVPPAGPTSQPTD